MPPKLTPNKPDKEQTLITVTRATKSRSLKTSPDIATTNSPGTTSQSGYIEDTTSNNEHTEDFSQSIMNMDSVTDTHILINKDNQDKEGKQDQVDITTSEPIIPNLPNMTKWISLPQNQLYQIYQT